MKYNPKVTTHILMHIDYSHVPWYKRLLIVFTNFYQPLRFILTGVADYYKTETKYLEFDGINLVLTPNEDK